ncbi:hydrogenase subunit MbhD domain-containing protein [Planctomycetota bacterium]
MNHWMDCLIVALLPLTALLAVIQTRPYFALVSRGIMGTVAVLLYAVLGAPDVALTEALVGTLLTVILYAIAVRSSLVLRLGVVVKDPAQDVTTIQRFCSQYNLGLRWRVYDKEETLLVALRQGQIDAVCAPAQSLRAWIPQLGDMPDDQQVTVLAPHGRWHEKKMRALFHEGTVIVRRIQAMEAGEG